MKEVLDQHKDVFSEGLGSITHSRLSAKAEAQPVRPHSVPFAIRGAIEQEIRSFVKAGIIEEVEHSEWAAEWVAEWVAVSKKDGYFGICGDYRVTVNPVMAVEQYPLPKPQDCTG